MHPTQLGQPEYKHLCDLWVFTSLCDTLQQHMLIIQ